MKLTRISPITSFLRKYFSTISRTAAQTTLFIQHYRLGAFYWKVHIRPPTLYSVCLKSYFFKSLTFSLVLFIHSLFISISMYKVTMFECRI